MELVCTLYRVSEHNRYKSMIGLNQYLVKFTLNSQTLKKIILKNVTVNPTEKKFKLSGTYELRNSATFK